MLEKPNYKYYYVMVYTLSVFTNARKKASGTDTHVGVIATPATAELTGLLTLNNMVVKTTFAPNYPSSAEFTSSTTNSVPTDLNYDHVVVVGTAINKLTLTASIACQTVSGTVALDIVEGANQLATINVDGSFNKKTITVTLTNVSAVSHTYDLRLGDGGGTYSFTFITGSQTGNTGFEVPTFTSSLLEYTDTHDGEIATIAVAGLDGENTMFARETSVLP